MLFRIVIFIVFGKLYDSLVFLTCIHVKNTLRIKNYVNTNTFMGKVFTLNFLNSSLKSENTVGGV